jgi:hypothetical protein
MSGFYEGYRCEWLEGKDPSFRVSLHPSKTPMDGGFRIVTCRYDHEAHAVKMLSESPYVHWDMISNKGLFDTRHGKWPCPMTQLSGLSRGEIVGKAQRSATYDIYWCGLLHSAPFREWVAAQFPTNWEWIKDKV